MIRCATFKVPERSTANKPVTAFDSCTGQPLRLPKFIDHPELKGRWAYERIFSEAAEPAAHAPAAEREGHRFKRMHFCARKMRMLLERHGAATVKRSDYICFARLHSQIRDEIVADNLGLVYSLHKRCRITHSDTDELLSEGMLALARAIELFNPWLGFRFSTYACNIIQRAVQRCGERSLKHQPSKSLDFVEGLCANREWLDTRRTEDSNLYVERLDRIFSENTAVLTPIERSILAQRFPLIPEGERFTLSEIGQKMNLSKERIRQIMKAALVKLRIALERDHVLNHEQRPGDLVDGSERAPGDADA